MERIYRLKWGKEETSTMREEGNEQKKIKMTMTIMAAAVMVMTKK